MQQEPATVAQSAAAETAQHEQPGNKTRDGAVDASKKGADLARRGNIHRIQNGLTSCSGQTRCKDQWSRL